MLSLSATPVLLFRFINSIVVGCVICNLWLSFSFLSLGEILKKVLTFELKVDLQCVSNCNQSVAAFL